MWRDGSCHQRWVNSCFFKSRSRLIITQKLSLDWQKRVKESSYKNNELVVHSAFVKYPEAREVSFCVKTFNIILVDHIHCNKTGPQHCEKRHNHMTLQQLVFLGGPTTSPVVAENLRTSMEGGPDSACSSFRRRPPLLLPSRLLLLLLRRCFSGDRFLLPDAFSPSSRCCCWGLGEFCCWCTALESERCFLRSDSVWETGMCCCCVGLLLLISCEVLLPLLRLAPDCCDEELGEKELFDILTFSDDVGETEMKK